MIETEGAPNWKLIDQATKDLASLKRDGTFTRQEIIEYINDRLLEGLEPRNLSSLNPMIQAVTVNAPGGAPGGLDKNLLYRVSRGIYKRYDPETDTVDPKQTLRFPLENVVTENSEDEVPFGRVDDRGAVVLPVEIREMLGVGPGSLVAFLKTDEGKIVLKRARLRLVTEE